MANVHDKNKEEIEDLTLNLLRKRYCNDYASFERVKLPSNPDFIKVMPNGKKVGLEVTRVAPFQTEILTTKSPKTEKHVRTVDTIKNRNIDEAMKTAQRLCTSNYVAIKSDGNLSNHSLHEYIGNKVDKPIDMALTCLTQKMKKLQNYDHYDSYELAILIPSQAMINPARLEGLMYEFQNFEVEGTFKRFYSAIHFVYTMNTADSIPLIFTFKAE